MVTRQSFIETLPDATDVNEHYAFIDAQAARGDVDTLRKLYTEIGEKCGLGPSDWAPRSVRERVVESLALTEGYENAGTAIELSQNPNSGRQSPDLRLSAVVSKLVAAQSATVIERLLASDLGLEPRAVILHEAVVRRKLMPDSGAAQAVAECLASHHHPLAILPLCLLDIEVGLLLPHYGRGSAGTSIPFGPFPNAQVNHFATDLGLVMGSETTTDDRANRISAAVKNWENESNGVIEARTFSLNAAALVGPLTSILVRLGLECIGPSDTLLLATDQSAKAVFTVLFSAAASGGAYNHGEFGAYGRLSAWRSLAGLTGSPEDSTFNEIERQARDCSWCLFTSSSGWYHQVAWDVGIACATPTQKELAVLAATDTD